MVSLAAAVVEVGLGRLGARKEHWWIAGRAGEAH